MSTEHALVALARGASTPSSLRDGALAVLCADLEADLGIFVALEAGREVRTMRGLTRAEGALVGAGFRRSARDLGGAKARAFAEGATTDRRVLGERLEHTALYREVMAPLGGTETLLVVPSAGGYPLGLIALGRRRRRFSGAAVAQARALVPVLSVACLAASAPRGALPSLTEAESDLLEYLELGLSTAQIAEARGTSFFTVRNQLAGLYRRLGVSNRAEALGRYLGRR